MDDLLTVNTAPVIQEIIMKPVADMPVKHHQFSIYANRHADAGGFNERP